MDCCEVCTGFWEAIVGIWEDTVGLWEATFIWEALSPLRLIVSGFQLGRYLATVGDNLGIYPGEEPGLGLTAPARLGGSVAVNTLIRGPGGWKLGPAIRDYWWAFQCCIGIIVGDFNVFYKKIGILVELKFAYRSFWWIGLLCYLMTKVIFAVFCSFPHVHIYYTIVSQNNSPCVHFNGKTKLTLLLLFTVNVTVVTIFSISDYVWQLSIISLTHKVCIFYGLTKILFAIIICN